MTHVVVIECIGNVAAAADAKHAERSNVAAAAANRLARMASGHSAHAHSADTDNHVEVSAENSSGSAMRRLACAKKRTKRRLQMQKAGDRGWNTGRVW